MLGIGNVFNDLSNKVCVPKNPEDLYLSVFNMITGIHEWKTLKIIYNAKVNKHLMVENVIQISSGITIDLIRVDANAKNIIYVNIGILLYAVAKIVNI